MDEPIIIHLTRTVALRDLGRLDEARASMQAATARLAITLEGADDFMLEVVEEGGLPVLELRALAAGLGPLRELAGRASTPAARPGRLTTA